MLIEHTVACEVRLIWKQIRKCEFSILGAIDINKNIYNNNK